METLTIADLAEQLKRLQDDNRRLRRRAQVLERAGLVTIVIGAVGFLVGAARQGDQPKTVEAERFVVKDEDGNVYAQLGLYRGSDGRFSGATRLAFYDGDGGLRTNYGVGSEHNPYLNLIDADGRDRGGFDLSSNGWMSFHCSDKSGKTGISLSSQEDTSSVHLQGPTRRIGVNNSNDYGGLFVKADGSTMLHLFRPVDAPGAGRTERLHLGIGRDGTAKMVLRGPEYEGGIRAIVSPQGESRLTVDEDVAP